MSGTAEVGHMYSATIRINKASSASYKKALGEIKAHDRSRIAIKETSSLLQIDIHAKDAAALRATINSALKDLHVVESVSNL
ncbi:MAG: CTAG/PCC1 family protein [Candidatus Micrarchaeota archaeon]|nr:CTAG/PCC1 family protein [Candidatus Micrarchaeota archaeon]